MEPHTQAKHTILRHYLQAWLPIMSSLTAKWASDGRGRLVLVDGFAGPGRYDTGDEGSPLIMLKAFIEHTQIDRITAELVYLFIEERQDRLEYLQGEVANLDLPEQVKCSFERGRFQDVFTDILDDIQEQDGQLAPTFAFIDPFGYTGAPMHLTGRFLTFERCEALVYMPLPFVNRFIGREGQAEALTSLYGSERWRKAVPLKGSQRIEYLHELFQEQLSFKNPDRLVRSFEIPTAKGTGYRLYFTTSHKRGLEKMKSAMWAADPFEGKRFRDTTDQDLVLFQPEPDTGRLLHQLRTHFGKKEFSIEEAECFTLLHTAFLPKAHLKKRTLIPQERTGKLEVVNTPRKRAFTLPATTRMRFLS